MPERHSSHNLAFFQTMGIIRFRHLPFARVFICLVLLGFVSLMSGCGSGGGSADSAAETGPDPIEDAFWIAVQGGMGGAWQEFINIGSLDELQELGTLSVESGGVSFLWTGAELSISDSGGDGKIRADGRCGIRERPDIDLFLFADNLERTVGNRLFTE